MFGQNATRSGKGTPIDQFAVGGFEEHLEVGKRAQQRPDDSDTNIGTVANESQAVEEDDDEEDDLRESRIKPLIVTKSLSSGS